MTAAKIAITLPPAQLARAQAAVRAGRAASVSAYIVRAIERQEREDALATLVRDLIEQHGEPTAKERAWAKRVLKRHRKRA
jgi:Arc/MetJ-type ribon-helix-helix transcriptional regulator